MNNAKLYNKFNDLQIHDAEEIIDKFIQCNFAPSLKACNLIDIGSGCGEVLSEVVVKKLGFCLSKVIGIDISDEMVQFATQTYGNKLINFVRLDILSDLIETEDALARVEMKTESADIVTSLYCFHWIKDLRNAFLKAKNLIKPGGYLVCSLLKSSFTIEAYLKFSTDEKYSEFMHDVSNFIPILCKDNDSLSTLQNIFDDLGFEVKLLEVKKDVFDYKTRLDFQHSMRAVNFFFQRMTNEELQRNFLDDLADYLENSNYERKLDVEDAYKAPYEIIYIVVLKK